ncbi:hypothetical protein ABT317_43730, partial [Streptomyces carpinensis]
ASPSGAELPGEAAALAAFRKARIEQADASNTSSVADISEAPAGAPSGQTAARAIDAGVVRIGAHEHTPTHEYPAHVHAQGSGTGRARRTRRARRTSWGRPVRLAVSAALAAGAVGGVAAATTGVLPTPFGGDEPAPAASVSDRATPDSPLVSAPPDGTPGGEQGASTPGGSPAGSPGADENAGRTPGHDSTTGRDGGKDAGSNGRWSRLAGACRDLRDGKDLDADRKHVLEGAAGGPSHVWTYCKGLLKSDDGRGSEQGGGNDQGDNGGGQKDQGGDKNGKGGKGGGGAQGDQGGQSGQSGQNGRGGQGGEGDDEGGHISGGRPRADAANPASLGARPPKKPARTAAPAPTTPPARSTSPAAGEPTEPAAAPSTTHPVA